MYKIQSNISGTRTIDVSDEHLQTIDKYQLFRDLIDSNGYVDEPVLEKLKLNIRWNRKRAMTRHFSTSVLMSFTIRT